MPVSKLSTDIDTKFCGNYSTTLIITKKVGVLGKNVIIKGGKVAEWLMALVLKTRGR